MPIAFAQVLGTSEENDSYPSLFVCVDNLRLLFNAGEGTQRLCNEHGVKILKAQHLFLSHLSWKTWGGAPDLMFLSSDTGNPGINIYGPQNLRHFLLINHYYFWRPDYIMGTHELNDSSVIKFSNDEVIVKSFILLSKNHSVVSPSSRIMNSCYKDVLLSKKQEEEEGIKIDGLVEDNHDHDHNDADADTDPQRQFELPNVENCDSLEMSAGLDRPTYFTTPETKDTVVCYVVQTPIVPGKFDMAAATKLGVPKGPLCGKLVKGETIELPNGKKVSPEDCVGAPTPGPIILIISCPSMDFVDSLSSHSGFEPLMADSKTGRNMFIFHISPDHVIASPVYQSWMQRFSPKTQHVAMHGAAKKGEKIDLLQSPYKASLAMLMKLNKIDSQIFPIPSTSTHPTLSQELPASITRAECLMKANLQPIASFGIDKTEIPAPLKLSEVSVSPDLELLLQEYNKKKEFAYKSAPEYLKNLTSEEAEIVFLGTGAAIPNKLRTVTSIFVNFFAKGGLLLDAGESAYTQLCRKYGAKIDEILINLKCIWISHKHADHHLSLPTVLIHRQEAYERANKEITPLTIVAPFFISGYLEEASWFHPLYFNLFNCYDMRSESNILSEFFMETLGLSLFYNIRVPHIPDSYGLVFKSVNGWKLVFSGDTSACEQLAKEGEGATVMIHEATMENSLQHEADGRGHSSTHDAITIGNKMGSYRTILTHFSARHHAYPVIDFVDNKHDNVAVAFDLMTVNLKDLPHLPLTIAPLVQIYKEMVNEKQ